MGEQWGGPTTLQTNLFEGNNSQPGFEYRSDFVQKVKQLLFDYCQQQQFFSITHDDINNSKITVSDVTNYLAASSHDVNVAAKNFFDVAINNAKSFQDYAKNFVNDPKLWVALKILIGQNYNVNLAKLQYYKELGIKVHDPGYTDLRNITGYHKSLAKKKNSNPVHKFKLSPQIPITTRTGFKGTEQEVSVDPYKKFDPYRTVGEDGFYEYTQQEIRDEPFSMINSNKSTSGGAPTKKRKTKLHKNKSKSKGKRSRKSRKSKRRARK